VPIETLDTNASSESRLARLKPSGAQWRLLGVYGTLLFGVMVIPRLKIQWLEDLYWGGIEILLLRTVFEGVGLFHEC
jgi:hypothetical protein